MFEHCGDIVKEQTSVAASKGVSRRSRRNNEAARYTRAETTRNVVKLAPSIVAMAALLLSCATADPSPPEFVGAVLITIRFRWTPLCAFGNESVLLA
jgi:hypothetical protein